MNFVIHSGYLTVTELFVRCRLLNTFYCTMIMKLKPKSSKGQILHYNKGQKKSCSKCKLTRVIRKDPFNWVKGLRCKSCMPTTITYTNACKLLKRKKFLLFSINCVHALSPYGRKMSLYLFADITAKLQTSTVVKPYK